MVTERVAAGWKPYLLSFMFEQIGGSPQRVQKVMEAEAERVYATLLTRIVRDPLSPSHAWKRPVWIGCVDFPVPKHGRKALRDVSLNDGAHLHFIALVGPNPRMKESLAEHLDEDQARYVRHPLFRIHAVEITDTPARATRYVLKSLERGRVSPDDVIVLPRAVSELRSAA